MTTKLKEVSGVRGHFTNCLLLLLLLFFPIFVCFIYLNCFASSKWIAFFGHRTGNHPSPALGESTWWKRTNTAASSRTKPRVYNRWPKSDPSGHSSNNLWFRGLDTLRRTNLSSLGTIFGRRNLCLLVLVLPHVSVHVPLSGVCVCPLWQYL